MRADISDSDDEITATDWRLVSLQERGQGMQLLHNVLDVRGSALTSATASTATSETTTATTKCRSGGDVSAGPPALDECSIE
jgi:hypothetical protein